MSQKSGNNNITNYPPAAESLTMDPPAPAPAAAESLPIQRRRRRAHSIEVYFLFIICFAILSLFLFTKLHPLAWNEVQNGSIQINGFLPQKNQQLDSGRFDPSMLAEAGSCATVIKSITDAWLPIVWPQEAPDEISEIVKSLVKGDFVEVDNSSGNDCHEVGRASLAAAIIQRAVKRVSTCNPQQRAIWLVTKNNNELCVKKVRKAFEEHNFVIFNETNPTAVSEGVDVPVFLLQGDVTTWADSKIRDIAVLRFSKSSAESSYKDTLFALFAFYRRVRVNGYIISDQYSRDEVSSHMRAMEVFFTDAENNSFISKFCGICQFKGTNFDCNTRVDYMKKSYAVSTNEAVKDLLSKDLCVNPQFSLNTTHGNGALRLMKKNDTRVRVPTDFRIQEIVPIVDPKVTKSWDQLNQWHSETVRKFFGHVGTNPYQTYRYIEAIRHIIQQKQQQTQYEVRVNVCETGFNGGHSAMLFLSFLDLENGIKVHYYGWDLKEVGSSLPTAEKMEREFGDHFHIVWGDSKKTLKNANETMSGQKCDLIVVDGEHSRNGVVNDLQNLLVVAEKGAIVFGDDCAPYKRTVPKSEEMLDGWNSFVTAGDLISVAMYRNPELGSPGFVEGIVPGSNGEYILGL